jgi:hypothetical protein
VASKKIDTKDAEEPKLGEEWHQGESLQSVVNSVLGSSVCHGKGNPTKLFTYLWENRTRLVPIDELWEVISRNKDVDKKKRDANVRSAIASLRRDLKSHFPTREKSTDEKPASESPIHKWRIDVLNAVRGDGYQITWMRVDDPSNVTRNFWNPHFSYEGNNKLREILILFNEYQFFQYWPDLSVFRLYDVNRPEDLSKLDDPSDLRKPHYDHYVRKVLRPSSPYLTWGEVAARDRIIDWFDRYEATQVTPVILRHATEAQWKSYWNQSLILLGSTAGNPFIEQVLKHNPKLPIRMELPSMKKPHRRPSVIISSALTDSEQEHFNEVAEDEKTYSIRSEKTEAGLELQFIPEKGWALLILTRVPNPRSTPDYPNPVTILLGDYTRALLQVAAFLTNEADITNNRYFNHNLPNYFQALFLVQTRDEREHKVTDPRDVQVLLFRELIVNSDNQKVISDAP